MHDRWSGALSSLGFFTALPVPAPMAAEHAMQRALRWCPLTGCILAAGATAVAAVASWLYPGGAGNLIAATLAVSSVVVATRGLHLDGLADTADGLGPMAGRQRALTVMRQPDIGPFGVAALVLVLLLQVTALARALDVHRGLPAVAESVLVGRLAMMRAGVPGIPAARPEGLGMAMAGSVPIPLVVVFAAALAIAAGAPALLGHPTLAWHLLIGLPAGMAVAELVLRLAVRRLGGVTGDVFGAVCEVASAGTLLAVAAA